MFLIGVFILFLLLFSLIGAVIIVQVGHVSIFDIQALNDYSNPQLVKALKIAQIVSSFGTFIIPVILFVMMASYDRLAYLKLNTPARPATVILGGILMLLALPAINWMAELNSHLQLPAALQRIETWMKDSEQKAEALTNAFIGHQDFMSLLTNLFMIGLLAAVAEELFFRGALQRVLIEWTKSVHWGIWIAGFLFSFLHFEFYGFLPRMLMGVYLGYLFVWTGTIWAPILAHFLNNSTALFFAYFEDKGMLPKDIDQVGSDNSQIVYVIISVVLVGLGMWVIYRMEKKETTVVN